MATRAPTLPLILAHLGHWYISLPLYLGPILLISAGLTFQDWRERRRSRRAAKAAGASSRRARGRRRAAKRSSPKSRR